MTIGSVKSKDQLGQFRQQAVISSSACSGPNYSASASATYTISGNTLTFDVGSFAKLYTFISFPQSEILADANLNLDVYSTDYVGAAYVVFTGNVTPGGDFNTGIRGITFQTTPGYRTTCEGFLCQTSGPNCGLAPVGTTPNCDITQPVEFQTGRSDVFNVFADADSQAINGLGYGAATVNGTFSFFEADGVTPLDVTLAPEPASAFLLGCSLLLLASLARRHRLV